MKILRLRAYFYPEITAGIHLDLDICKALSENRIQYISYTPRPTRGVTNEDKKNYIKKEFLFDGYVEINRFSMFDEGSNPSTRFIRYCLCSFIEFWLGSKEKGVDIVFSSSTPPTQGFLSAIVAKILSKRYGYKVPFVYNLQDVFPDSLVNAGMTSEGSIVWKIGRLIENYTYLHSDRIIVISKSFRNNLIKKGVPKEKIVVIPNWVDLESVHPVKKVDNPLFDTFGVDRTKFIVLYAGNMGDAQGTDIIIDAAKDLLPEKNIQFVIFGGGSKYSDYKKRVTDENIENVFITSLQPSNLISEVYSMGDVDLITSKPGTNHSGMPSKTWSIMACNTPIIASFDLQSDLADVICESKCGVCVMPGNYKALSGAIMESYIKWKQGQLCSVNNRDYLYSNVSKDKCVQSYIDIFNQVFNETSLME